MPIHCPSTVRGVRGQHMDSGFPRMCLLSGMEFPWNIFTTFRENRPSSHYARPSIDRSTDTFAPLSKHILGKPRWVAVGRSRSTDTFAPLSKHILGKQPGRVAVGRGGSLRPRSILPRSLIGNLIGNLTTHRTVDTLLIHLLPLADLRVRARATALARTWRDFHARRLLAGLKLRHREQEGRAPVVL